MTRTVSIIAAGFVALGIGSVFATASQQRPDAKAPPLVISSMYGADLFEMYCSSCHGRDGRGGGPTAAALTVAPSDLTQLARRNDGVFPAARITQFVTGDTPDQVRAHGSKDMPVWGPIFRALDANDTANRIRVDNIVAYLERLQEKP